MDNIQVEWKHKGCASVWTTVHVLNASRSTPLLYIWEHLWLLEIHLRYYIDSNNAKLTA